MAEKSNISTLVVFLLEEINIYEHGVDHRCQLGSVDLQDVKELMFACFLREALNKNCFFRNNPKGSAFLNFM